MYVFWIIFLHVLIAFSTPYLGNKRKHLKSPKAPSIDPLSRKPPRPHAQPHRNSSPGRDRLAGGRSPPPRAAAHLLRGDRAPGSDLGGLASFRRGPPGQREILPSISSASRFAVWPELPPPALAPTRDVPMTRE